MANAAKLKDQARAAEHRDQWREAIVLYRQLLEEAPEGAEADIALWNRVGDLHMRVNEPERAVEAYEHAVTAYADSGLYNNAIALCRKILRLLPGRGAIYLRLGQISAAAGFLADARQNFLEYATRMQRAGKLDASFEALREFADLSPEDTDVRRLLADQLLSHGHRDQAVEQLRILLGVHQDHGDEAAAQAVLEQIHAVDPDAEATPLATSRGAARQDDFDAALHDGSRAAPPAPASADEPGLVEPADVEVGGVADVEPLPGLESTSLDDVAPLAGLESTSLVDAAPPPGPAPPLLDAEDEDEGEPLPLILPGAEDEDEGDAGDDLPLLDFDAPPAAPRAAPADAFTPDRIEQMRAHVAAVPEDAAAREELVRELRSRGLGHEVPEVLENAHRAMAARGMYYEALGPITALIGIRPDDGLLLQKRVEYAFRSGRAEAQVEAYLDLGRHLVKTGRGDKAGAVFQRVLELDPHNVEARAAAPRTAAPAARAAAAPPPPQPPAAPPPPAGDWVDLGALILEGEAAEPTTRFVVEEKEPSGDEDRDFAEMLAHFRQKVTENIEVEDSSSHYDLGVAFMEMGLVDEAIAQFQVALRGGANPLATLELLGQCFVEKAQYAVAARVLDRALRLPGVSDGDLAGVLYLLGRTEEGTDRPAEALAYYERVVAVDIRFRDTAQRIEQLRRG